MTISKDRIDRFVSKKGEIIITKSPEDVKREKEKSKSKDKK